MTVDVDVAEHRRRGGTIHVDDGVPYTPRRAPWSDADDPPPPDDASAPSKPKLILPTTIDLHWAAAADELDRRHEQGFAPVPTGIAPLDHLLGGGFERGALSIICGGPGGGKTSWVTDVGLTFARNRSKARPVLFWSLEMPRIDILARITSLECALPWNEIRRGEHNEAFRTVGRALAGTPFLVLSRQDCGDIASLRRYATMLADHHGEQPVIAVDYCQLIADASKEIRQAVEAVADGLLELALNGFAVVALSSIGRGAYSVATKDGRPDLDRALAMAKESGKIEFNASTVVGIVRVRTTDEQPRAQRAWMAVPKVRLGGTRGAVAVTYDGLAGKFTALPEADMPRLGADTRDYLADVLKALTAAEARGDPLTSQAQVRAHVGAGAGPVRDAIAAGLQRGRIRLDGKAYRAVPESE